MSIYNRNGVEIADLSRQSDFALFSSNMQIDYKYDSVGDANYTVIRVFKNRLDGTKQYPFVCCPNGLNAATESTLSMQKRKNYPLAINAGLFDMSTRVPLGIVIQNGVLIQDRSGPGDVLIIDANGNLSADNNTSGADLVSAGIVSAIGGIGRNPIINNYTIPSGVTWITDNAQRQIIGQFGNGDYAVVTCEGRNYDHSDGWTIAEAQRVCQELGLKFAFNLDGGGSTETVIGKKQINTIYENTEGRIVPTYIVFNGTDTFKTSME